MKKGDYQKALSELETANLAVKTPENYKNMAKCKERQGQIEEAHEFYKDALEVANKPDKGNENKREKNIMKAGIYLDRGKLWMSQRKYLNAKKDFDDAILISDSKVDAQLSAEVSYLHSVIP